MAGEHDAASTALDTQTHGLRLQTRRAKHVVLVLFCLGVVCFANSRDRRIRAGSAVHNRWEVRGGWGGGVEEGKRDRQTDRQRQKELELENFILQGL